MHRISRNSGQRLGWKKFLLFSAVVSSVVFIVVVVFLSTALYLYWKPRYDAAQKFDLEKLEKSNIDQDRVRYEDISTNFINALIATEDPGFFHHTGMDFHRMGKAILRNIRDDGSEGADTITRQLVHIAFREELSKSLSGSTMEMFLARRVERALEKEQILELFCNRVYFGEGYYGISAAADGYFAKSPGSLTVSEAALLVAVIRNPHYRSPKLYPVASKRVRDYVLQRMNQFGFLTVEALQSAKRDPVRVVVEPYLEL